MKDVFAEPQLAAYPPFEARYLRAIELALRMAWANLQNDVAKSRKLSTVNEERISHMLREALNTLREKKSGGVSDYNCSAFERPQVGAEIMTRDGKIRKPDIVFALSGSARPGVTNSLKDAIFVECKILQLGSRTVAAYCDNGIHRFVEGSYAERMREGMMLAYVRSSQTLPGDLAATMAEEKMKVRLATDAKLSPCGLTRLEPLVYLSTHKRNWSYPDNEGIPGPIAIRHLWLHV